MTYKPQTDKPSVDRVRELFAYDKESGCLHWKTKPSKFFRNSLIGTKAGMIEAHGHPVIMMAGAGYMTAQLVWAHQKGEWPDGRLSAINGDITDTRVENLRIDRSLDQKYVWTREGKAEYGRAHRAKYRERYRDAHLKKTFGISLADYDALLAAQGGKCAVCRGDQTSTRWGENTPFHVDHCHATGKVRGLLCAECNTGLGKFSDDITRLIRAAEYVRRHQAPTNVIAFPPGKDSTAPADMARAS